MLEHHRAHALEDMGRGQRQGDACSQAGSTETG